MKRFALALLAPIALALALLSGGAPTPAAAAPLSYCNTSIDTVQAVINSCVITPLNSSLTSTQYVTSASGTTAITAQGLRVIASTTGLTTAAGVTSATITVTDASVTAVSQVFCQAMAYGGTGNPMPVDIVPAAGSFSYAIQNTHASAALNATVPISCMVYN